MSVWIKRNLGLLLISILERKNAWRREDYNKNVKKNLPLYYEIPSRIIKKVELFRRVGFKDVSIFEMKEVTEISQKKQKEAPLRYKLAWSDFSDYIWYYTRAVKENR